MNGADVAVHCGRWGEFLLDALRASLPGTDLVATGTTEAAAPTWWRPWPTDGRRWPTVLGPSVRWVHILGAGADGFPFDVLVDRVLTVLAGRRHRPSPSSYWPPCWPSRRSCPSRG